MEELNNNELREYILKKITSLVMKVFGELVVNIQTMELVL